MQFVGIDLSLTSTGLALYYPDGVEAPDTMTIKTKPPGAPGYESSLHRFQLIAGRIRHEIGQEVPGRVHVCLEGPSYNSVQSAHVMSGNWWNLYGGLMNEGFKITVVPPAVVKMYATGKGNASKDAVLAAAIKRYPDVDIPGNDIADAVILLAIGCRLAGRPLEYQLPATHLRALEKLGKS